MEMSATIARAAATQAAVRQAAAASFKAARLPCRAAPSSLPTAADYDCSGYSSEVQTICAGFKRYGLIVADNGSDWYVSGAPDSRWNDEALADLGNIVGDAFEVVYTGDVTN